LFVGSAFQIRRSTIGLELSDVLPGNYFFEFLITYLLILAHTAPGKLFKIKVFAHSKIFPLNKTSAAFLRARDEYFSFYPMFVVIRGEELDFSQRQTEIDHLRNEIGK
jgi:hypothetical protein